jgi:protein disulfide-isomerase
VSLSRQLSLRNIYIVSFAFATTLAAASCGRSPMSNSSGAERCVWQTNFDAAKRKAKDEQRFLLVDFTGSDWCPWCMKLKGEVFDQAEFKAEAPKRFVLVELDYPRRKQLAAELKKQNDQLKKRYRISEYPTILLLDATGRVVARTGYQPGGAAQYLKHLAGLVENYQSTTQSGTDATGFVPTL